MTLITILIGIALIILGRKALWLGVFSGSFLAGVQLLSYVLFDQPESTIWILSAIAASFILMLYLTLEKAMVVILGALGGGFFAFSICNASGFLAADTFSSKFAIYVAGGLVGILLMKLVFEWTMKAFTALVGAYMVSSFLIGQPIFQLLALVVLAIIGITIQGNGTVKLNKSDYPETFSENYVN